MESVYLVVGSVYWSILLRECSIRYIRNGVELLRMVGMEVNGMECSIGIE